MGFDYRTSTGLGKETLGGHKQNLVRTRRQEKFQESPVEVWVDRGLLRVRGAEYNSENPSPFEGGNHYHNYPYHSFASGQTTGWEHSPAHQQKTG